MITNKKITVYLLNKNLTYEKFLLNTDQYSMKKFQIDKSRFGPKIVKGQICIFENKGSVPQWTGYIKEMARAKKISIKKKIDQKAIVFITISLSELFKNVTFALTFGGSRNFLNNEFIVQDFALKTSKSIVEPDQISEIDTTTFDRKFYSTRKQAVTKLLPEKLIDSREYNIVKKFNGHGQANKLLVSASEKERIFLGGETGLTLTGKFNLTSELINLLISAAQIYYTDTEDDQLVHLPDNLKKISAPITLKNLNKELGKKLEKALSSDSLDHRNLRGIRIQPQKIFDLSDFNGFFITGLGYKDRNVAGDFSIDEVDFFDQFKRRHVKKGQTLTSEYILEALTKHEIKRKFSDGLASEKVCTVYQALSVEIAYKKQKYILLDGNWYEINKEFYLSLKTKIDSISEVPISIKRTLNYISFDKNKHVNPVTGKKSEGTYNEDFTLHNALLMLDRTKYSPGSDFLRKLNLKTGSNIEISDIFQYNVDCIHFIHVKRHSGASGTSHLLSQAITSATLFNEDTDRVIKFIQKEIREHNKRSKNYSLCPFTYTKQKKYITLAIIDKSFKKGKKNSEMLTILEMVSVLENVNKLKLLGYDPYLKFIQSSES